MEVRGVVDDLRLLPDGRIGVVDEAVDEELAVEERQRLLADVLDADGFPSRERVSGIRHEAAAAREELAVDELLREARLVIRHGDVELFFLDHVERLDAARLDDVEHDFGMCGAELAEDARQEERANLQRHRHADVVAMMREIANLVLELVREVEDVRDAREQVLAVVCQQQPPSFAVKEVQPRLGLERLHRNGDCRLRDVQRGCRLRDVLPLADGRKVSHLRECHHGIVSCLSVLSLFTYLIPFYYLTFSSFLQTPFLQIAFFAQPLVVFENIFYNQSIP